MVEQNEQYAGPVPEGYSEEKFRKTGKTKKKFSTRLKEARERISLAAKKTGKFTKKALKETGQELEQATRKFEKKSKILRKKIPKKYLKKRVGGIISARLRKFATQKKAQRQQVQQQPQQRMMVQGGKVYTPDGRINIPATIDLKRKERNERKKKDRDMHNLMRAHHQMANVRMDFLEEKGTILHAENMFAAGRSNNIMKTNRPSILQAKEGGNQLSFFK